MQKTDTNTDPDTVIETSYQYDSVYNGKVQAIVTDSLGYQKVYLYNSNGTLASETDKGDPNAGGEMVISYLYDDNDNLIQQTAPDSSVTTFTYDDMGRLTKTEYSLDYYIEYTYDDNGNQLTMTKTKGTKTVTNAWEYDDQDRVVTVSLNGSVVVKYDYTTAGYLREVWYPEGEDWRITKYTYNSDGLLTGAYDATNPQNEQLIREYAYSDGILTNLKDYRKFDQANDDGDYSLQEFAYDTVGRLQGVTWLALYVQAWFDP